MVQLPARPESCPKVGPVEDVPFFVDWLTISQDHHAPAGWNPERDGAWSLPLVDSGVVMCADSDGELVWKTVRGVQHQGSFETSLQLRCDGHRVTFSGNVSRFGRPDNLFGFGFFECLQRINAVLAEYGLPAFTGGTRRELLKRGGVVGVWSGARVSRIDVTANYLAGSEANAHAVLQYLGSQHAGRKSGQVQGSGETVDFGRGSRRQYWKAYIKGLELVKHAKKRGAEVDPQVLEYCQSNGLVRFEGTIKSNALSDLGCAFLGDYESGWAMGQLIQLFKEHSEVLNRCEKSTDDLDELPRHLRATARDYLAGMDCTVSMSRPTFYRHRRELLAFGLDISVRNVRPFQPRVQVVELVRAQVPNWYQLAA